MRRGRSGPETWTDRGRRTEEGFYIPGRELVDSLHTCVDMFLRVGSVNFGSRVCAFAGCMRACAGDEFLLNVRHLYSDCYRCFC